MRKRRYISPTTIEVTVVPSMMLLQASTTKIPVKEDFDNEDEFIFAARGQKDPWTDEHDEEEE